MSEPSRKTRGLALALVLLAGCSSASPVADQAREPVTVEQADTGWSVSGSARVTAPAGGARMLPRTDPSTSTSGPNPTSTPVPAPSPPTASTEPSPATTEAAAGPAGPPAPEPAPEPATEPAPEPPPSTVSSSPPIFLFGAAAEFLASLNDLRARVGLASLSPDDRLIQSAAAQVDVMVDNATLSHQNLQDELGQGWSIVGENVGYGPNTPAIHQALANSPGHYANMVNSRFDHVGIAVKVDGNGRLWVAQVFGG